MTTRTGFISFPEKTTFLGDPSGGYQILFIFILVDIPNVNTTFIFSRKIEFCFHIPCFFCFSQHSGKSLPSYEIWNALFKCNF